MPVLLERERARVSERWRRGRRWQRVGPALGRLSELDVGCRRVRSRRFGGCGPWGESARSHKVQAGLSGGLRGGVTVTWDCVGAGRKRDEARREGVEVGSSVVELSSGGERWVLSKLRSRRRSREAVGGEKGEVEFSSGRGGPRQMTVEELDAAPAGACADLLREGCISHPCLWWCGRQRLTKTRSAM